MEEHEKILKKRLKTLDRALIKADEKGQKHGYRPSGGKWRRCGQESGPCGLWIFLRARMVGRGNQ